MKSDSERQTAYQKRRLNKEVRVTFWLHKQIDEIVNEVRGDESKSSWINRAILTALKTYKVKKE